MRAISAKTSIAEMGAIVCEALKQDGLDQAIWVCQAQAVKLESIKAWSKVEGKLKAFQEFEEALKQAKRAKGK
jgi:hypothetical protein